MDKDFSWNARPDVDAMLANAGNPMNEVNSIRARIDALKAERARLVEQLGTEYGDEALGAQMMRAGDEGAMYKFLRGQQDQLRMNAAEKAKEGMPTQADVDKLLETLYATEASITPDIKGDQLTKTNNLLNLYRNQLGAMQQKNPSLDFRGYQGAGAGANVPAGNGGGELNKFKYELYSNDWDDDEIDAKVKALADQFPDYLEDIRKAGDEAKKRSDTAYAKYTADINQKNAMLKQLYDAWGNVNDSGSKRTLFNLFKAMGGRVNNKGNAVYLKKKSKKDWIKGK